MGEAIGWLAVDSSGKLFPCYAVRDTIVLVTPPGGTNTVSFPPLRSISFIVSVGDAAPAVCLGYGFTGDADVNPTAFTAFFIAPNILATARHNLYDDKKDDFPKLHHFAIELGSMVTMNHKDREYIRAEVIYEPDEEIYHPKRGVIPLYDFAFLKVDYQHNLWLKPSTKEVQKEEVVVTLQFNGIVTQEWVAKQKQLWIESQKQRGVEEDIASRFPDKVSTVVYALRTRFKSVSPGIAKKILHPLIFYANTTSPGSSGAPGFASSSPIEFSFIHGGGTTKEPYNHGMLANNSVFIAAYKDKVIPNLPTI